MPSVLERRLRAALADTSETPPRPVTPIELPLRLNRLITPKLLRSLQPAAVLVPVIRRQAGLTVLLTRRADHLRNHKGQISFPGGRCERDDGSAAATALREAHEEVGLDPRAIEVIGYLDDYPTVTRYRVTPVVGIVSGSPSPRPDEREVAEAFEVPLDFLLRADSYERKVFTNKGVNVPFFEIHYRHYRIWGATAGMLRNLAQKFGAVA